MERTSFDSFTWLVETTYELEDGTMEAKIEPFIGGDGIVRNSDGSVYRPLAEADPDAAERKVVQRTLILTVILQVQLGPNQGIVLPMQEMRFPLAATNPGQAGSLPAFERMAMALRGEVPPSQVVTAPAAALGGVLLGGPGPKPPTDHLGPNGRPR